MSLQSRLRDFAFAIATDIKQIRTWITGSTSGNLSGLSTQNKTNLIAAINEVNAKPVPVGATVSTKGVVELATLSEVAAGTDADRAVTPEGVRQERLALKTEILGAGVPEALDTLDELAAALAADVAYSATVMTSLSNRVRADVPDQDLTATQKANARTNIDAVAASDTGDLDTDLVAIYEEAKA